MNKKNKILTLTMASSVLTLGFAELSSTDANAVTFRSCSEAWSQGYGDIKRGEDGYSSKLDRDGDGVACEIANSNGQYRPRSLNGWTKNGSYWYYYKNGSLVRNAWVGSYYLKSDGRMASSEWIYDNSYQAWYYLKSDGSYAKNAWAGNYWLNSNGKMATNSWVDGGRYYVGSNGAWIKDPEGTSTGKTGWQKEGSTWYYYKNGNLVRNTWVGSYYLKSDGRMVSSEWIYDNSYQAWYYLKSDGSYAKNAWTGNYWLNSNGKMATNSWVDGGRYYVGSNGAWVPGK